MRTPELIEKEYKVFDFKDKTVLDVGRYIGYSTSLFLHWGAKKVVVHEV